MEDEEDWLLLTELLLILDVFLVLLKQFRMEFDIARLVYTMDVSETSCDREVRGDLLEGSVDLVDVFRLSIQRVVVHIFIVDTVLLSTSDADFLLAVSILLYLLVLKDLPSPAIASWERPA